MIAEGELAEVIKPTLVKSELDNKRNYQPGIF